MVKKSSLSVEIDTEAGAAYVRLSSQPVHVTEVFNEEINVDLDAMNVVVGIELLDLAEPIPLDALVTRYHVDSAALDLLLASISMQATASVRATSGSATTTAGYGALQAKELHRQRRPSGRDVAELT